jgi:hypothetical protein
MLAARLTIVNVAMMLAATNPNRCSATVSTSVPVTEERPDGPSA